MTMMDNSNDRLNFDPGNMNTKCIIAAKKSVLSKVGWRNVVGNGKYSPAKFLRILYIFV